MQKLLFDFNPTTRVVFGENSVERLGELARELGGKRALLVSDHGIAAAGHVERARRSLRQAATEVVVYLDVEENPTTRHVENGVRAVQENGPVDLIIGLGGGSVMDCAKGINFILTNGGRMEDYRGMGKASKPMLPAIGVPTTAGTGSEAQSFALIATEDTHEKMACGDQKARFRAVILDPVLLSSVPRQVAAVTGMDAISHAVESCVSTNRNPVSGMFAREAWRLLAGNFEQALNTPDDLPAWGNMLLAAHFAGMAIENSMLGAAHACANPLTAHYGVTHGIAVGLMLPHVVKFNAAVVSGEYAELARAAGVRIDSGADAAAQLARRIHELREMADLPPRLRACSIDRSDLPALAKAAAGQWTATFNPRPVGEAELLMLYRDAF